MNDDNSETGISFHIDYLGITVFQSFDEFKPARRVRRRRTAFFFAPFELTYT